MKFYIKRTEFNDNTKHEAFMDPDGHFVLTDKVGAMWFQQEEDAKAYIECEKDDPKYDKPWMGVCIFEIITEEEGTFVAMMESESRSWVALGKTEEEAKEAILTAWNEHQHKLQSHRWYGNGYEFPVFYDTVDALEEDYAINVVRLNAGECVHW